MNSPAEIKPFSESAPLAIEQIIHSALKLDPHKAIGLRDGSAVAACTSLVYTKIIDRKGETVPLRHYKYYDPHDEEPRACDPHDPDARYAAIYVRVSTPMQADDGWSTRDQCERAISYCIDKGWAFRIFNDQGLSGRLPMRESHAISRMYQRRADLYAYYFTKVFLDVKLSPRFTPLQKEMLARYRDERVGEYMKRRAAGGEEPGAGAESEAELLEIFAPESKRSVLHRKSYVKKQTAYRPALTYLLHLLPSVHALVITEQTRVCRSAALFLEIAEQIIRHRVTVHGTIQESGWFHQRDSGGNLMRGVFSAIAENQLFEVLMGSLRGISTMLLAGRPHSTIPFWLERDPHTSVAQWRNGDIAQPRTNAERKGLPTLKRLLEIWRESQVAGSDYGYQTVAKMLTEEGWPTPDDAGAWSAAVVRSTLLNPALRGVQVMFGIEWNVFPAVMSDAEFWKIQQAVQQRAGLFGAGHVPMYSNMLAGLLRCHCGATLVRDTNGLYRCRAVHNGRQKSGGRHVHVTQKRIEDFVDLWMNVCKDVTIASLRQDADGSSIRREMNRMAEQADALRRRLEAKRLEGRTAIEGHARAIIRASDPARFEEQINAMVSMFLAEDEEFKSLSEQYQQARTRQSQIERSLQRATPPVELKHLIETIESWDALKNVQKNEVLRALLTEMRFCGDPEAGTERLVFVKQSYFTNEFPEFPIETKKRGQSGFLRAFPDEPALVAWSRSLFPVAF